MKNSKLDIGKLANDGNIYEPEDALSSQEQQLGSTEDQSLVPVSAARQVVVHEPEMAWLEATESLQRNLVYSLQEYKTTWRQKRLLAKQRERMINEVAEQYVSYLREEAKLASDAALKARDAVLRQELAKFRSRLYTELADLTGATVRDIERIAQSYTAELTSLAIQQACAKFIMTKIFELLEQS